MTCARPIKLGYRRCERPTVNLFLAANRRHGGEANPAVSDAATAIPKYDSDHGRRAGPALAAGYANDRQPPRAGQSNQLVLSSSWRREHLHESIQKSVLLSDQCLHVRELHGGAARGEIGRAHV